MSSKDDDILEFLRDIYPTALPLTALYWNLEKTRDVGYSKDTVERRLRRLIEAGLVEVPRGLDSSKNQYFRITDRGIAYLDGEHAVEDLPDDFNANR